MRATGCVEALDSHPDQELSWLRHYISLAPQSEVCILSVGSRFTDAILAAAPDRRSCGSATYRMYALESQRPISMTCSREKPAAHNADAPPRRRLCELYELTGSPHALAMRLMVATTVDLERGFPPAWVNSGEVGSRVLAVSPSIMFFIALTGHSSLLVAPTVTS